MAEPSAPAAPPDPPAPPDRLTGVVSGASGTSPPCSPGTTRSRLRRLLGYALPHRGLVALSLALMGLQALAGSSRILLALPVLTRVLEMHVAGEPTSVPTGAGKPVRLPRVVRALDGTLDGLNRMTASLVPEGALDGAAATPDPTPEGRAAARARLLDKYATLLSVLLLFLAFIAATTVFAYFGDYVDERLRLRILMDVRRDVCARLLDQPMRFYDAAHRGDVVQRVLDDVNGVSSALKMLLASMPEGVLTLGAGLLVLGALSVELTLVCVLGLLLFVPLRRFTKRVKRLAKRRQGATARRVEVLLQTVSGIRTVKAFRAEDAKVAEFVAADREVFRESLDVQRTKSASDAATELVNNVLAMALTVGGGWLLLRESLPIGAPILAVFLMQVGGIHRPAKRLVKDLNSMNDALASVDRVFEILDLPGPPPDPAGAPAFPGLTDRVRFEHVGFAYRPGRPVLTDVSFDVRRGSTVALVGPSGAGKTTLCDLLLRLYEPSEGRITVDGAPLASYRRDSWLDRAAVVTQEPFLFHASIGENIGLGRQGATGAQIRAAAEAASIHDHVASLPQGYDAEVGERGARLSGGQRQRITIARALLRDPLVLVLDEATASLDAGSEREVQDAIERLRAGRTTLVVAHRLATVRRADAIVVLDGGRVVDRGTHDELLARGGLYARLCAMQDLGASSAATPPEAPGDAAAPARA